MKKILLLMLIAVRCNYLYCSNNVLSNIFESIGFIAKYFSKKNDKPKTLCYLLPEKLIVKSNCNDYYNNLLDNNSYLTTQQKVHLIQSKFPDRFFWQINSIITKAKTQQSLENIARHWTSGSEETEETIEPAHLKNKKTSTHNTKSQPLIKKQILPTISEETENLAKKFKNNRKSIKYINEKIHRFFYNDKRLYESIVFKDNQIDFLKLLENDTFLNNIYLSKLSKLKKVKTY